MTSESKRLVSVLVGTYIVQLLAAITYDLITFKASTPFLGVTPLVAFFVVLQVAGCFFTYKLTKARDFAIFKRRTDRHHRFIHYARDRAIYEMDGLPELSLNPELGDAPVAGNISIEQEAKISKLLSRMVRVFDLVVPRGAKVWACVRQLCHDGSYRTFIRYGDYNTDRRSSSKPLLADAPLVEKLHNLYKEEKECVVVTGQHDDQWTPMPNDKLDETRSVLIGAILAKEPSKEGDGFAEPKMIWMLCLCSDLPDAFNEGYKNLMKCCNDAFSWLLNTWIRK